MQDYTANITLHDAVTTLLAHKRIVITTHAKPDADAFGSVMALSTALRACNLDVRAIFMPPMPANFRSLLGYDTAKILAAGETFPEADLTVILDTGAWSKLSPIRDTLSKRLDKILILDHHLSGDVPAAKRYIDGKAAASCEIVADVLDAIVKLKGPGNPGLEEKIYNRTVADALFIGIAADTGWFRFSNTRPRTHELAAKLIRLGVDHADLYQKLEQTDRPEKLLLMMRALSSLKLLAGGRVAMMVLRGEDFAQTGALVEETERFVDLPQSVSSVEVVVIVTEPPKNADGHVSPIRVSFRSKPGPQAINVAALAGQFGGGGHARAAGAKITGTLEHAIETVSAASVKAAEQNI